MFFAQLFIIMTILQRFICLATAKKAITLIEANKTVSGLIVAAIKPAVATKAT
jgi:hypothetical protein